VRLSLRQILYGLPLVGIQMVVATVWFIPSCASPLHGTCNNNFAYETTLLGLTLLAVAGPAALVLLVASRASARRSASGEKRP